MSIKRDPGEKIAGVPFCLLNSYMQSYKDSRVTVISIDIGMVILPAGPPSII